MLVFLLALLKVSCWVAITYFFCNILDRYTGDKKVTKKFNFAWACAASSAYYGASISGSFHWLPYFKYLALFPLLMLAVLPFVFLFHWALFYTSKPIFQALMNATVDKLDIIKDGNLYLRRWYLTPRFHPPQFLLDWLEDKGLDKALRTMDTNNFWLKLRFMLQSRYFLHWIVRSDDDRDPHDHPWPFQSRILAGEYYERVWFPRDHSPIPYEVESDNRYMPVIGKRYWIRQCPTGTVVFNDWDHTHMVQIVKPVYSLVLAGPRAADEDNYWGFWKIHPTDPEKDEWVHRKNYINTGDEVRTEKLRT